MPKGLGDWPHTVLELVALQSLLEERERQLMRAYGEYTDAVKLRDAVRKRLDALTPATAPESTQTAPGS